MLKVENLRTAYRENEVLKGIDFEVQKGEILSILGQNGSGKTTLFKTIMNIKKYQGKITIEEKDIKTMKSQNLSLYISYVPQSLNINFNHTTMDIILTGYAPLIGFYQKPNKAQEENALNIMKELKIQNLSQRIYQSLSAGQKQLALIARALVLKTPIILMDEPLSNLDIGNQMRMLDLVKKLQSQGKTIILTTHNPSNAISLDSNTILLEKGKIKTKGKAREIINSDNLSQIYNYPLEVEIQERNKTKIGIIYKK